MESQATCNHKHVRAEFQDRLPAGLSDLLRSEAEHAHWRRIEDQCDQSSECVRGDVKPVSKSISPPSFTECEAKG